MIRTAHKSFSLLYLLLSYSKSQASRTKTRHRHTCSLLQCLPRMGFEETQNGDGEERASGELKS
jgi:hypothetical protein